MSQTVLGVPNRVRVASVACVTYNLQEISDFEPSGVGIRPNQGSRGSPSRSILHMPACRPLVPAHRCNTVGLNHHAIGIRILLSMGPGAFPYRRRVATRASIILDGPSETGQSDFNPSRPVGVHACIRILTTRGRINLARQIRRPRPALGSARALPTPILWTLTADCGIGCDVTPFIFRVGTKIVCDHTQDPPIPPTLIYPLNFLFLIWNIHRCMACEMWRLAAITISIFCA